MKVAVIGLGGTGSAAVRFLAAAGHEAVGFEQYAIGHAQGSSHGESRIIRYTYPELLYTEMMRDAYAQWHALEEESEKSLFERCGGVYMATPELPKFQRTENALIESGLPYEKLGPAEVADRFPGLRLFEGEAALFQKDSGFLRSTQCIFANVELARRHGATIHDETCVEAVTPHGEGVTVRVAGEDQYFDRAILAAGPWIGKHCAALGLPLQVTRQQVVYLGIARNPENFEPGRFPVWIDGTEILYGFPSDGNIEGVKMASHILGEEFDPDRPDRPISEPYLAEIAEYASRRMPDLSGEVTQTLACLYTNTPDEDFIIDHLPESDRIWLISGCSGHGFKFTVLLGKIAADLATTGTYKHDLSRFSIRRFKN